MEKILLTKEKQEELAQELKHLIEVERPTVIEEIKEARSQGDLSENAEFDAAREKQGMIEDRIKEIEVILSNAEVTKKASKNSKVVKIGSVVEIERLDTKDKNTYSIVGSLEANPFEEKISNNSPLAKAMLGKEVGQIVEVQAKNIYKVKILRLL